jgi:hypothetical protein
MRFEDNPRRLKDFGYNMKLIQLKTKCTHIMYNVNAVLKAFQAVFKKLIMAVILKIYTSLLKYLNMEGL